MAIMQIGRFHFETTTVNRLSNYVIIVFEKKILAKSLVEHPFQQSPTINSLSISWSCLCWLSVLIKEPNIIVCLTGQSFRLHVSFVCLVCLVCLSRLSCLSVCVDCLSCLIGLSVCPSWLSVCMYVCMHACMYVGLSVFLDCIFFHCLSVLSVCTCVCLCVCLPCMMYWWGLELILAVGHLMEL